MELKNPQTRLIFYAALSTVAIILLIIALRKNIDYSSFGNWLDSQLLVSSVMAISLPVQAWRAYKETRKIKEKEIE